VSRSACVWLSAYPYKTGVLADDVIGAAVQEETSDEDAPAAAAAAAAATEPLTLTAVADEFRSGVLLPPS